MEAGGSTRGGIRKEDEILRFMSIEPLLCLETVPGKSFGRKTKRLPKRSLLWEQKSRPWTGLNSTAPVYFGKTKSMGESFHYNQGHSVS
jgi:hypothetical protein